MSEQALSEGESLRRARGDIRGKLAFVVSFDALCISLPSLQLGYLHAEICNIAISKHRH